MDSDTGCIEHRRRMRNAAHYRRAASTDIGWRVVTDHRSIDADTLVSFRTAGAWLQDAQGVPQRIETGVADPHFDFEQPRLASEVELNHCFAGWDGVAELSRPSQGLSLRLVADPGLAHLMVYRPAAQAWLCLEPVSHATGAFSLKALCMPENGVRWIEPKESARVSMNIRIDDDLKTR